VIDADDIKHVHGTPPSKSMVGACKFGPYQDYEERYKEKIRIAMQ
jgi:hypothetical protein